MRKDKRFQRLVFLQHENEAQAVRFSVTVSLLLVGVLALPGCALFSKKPNDTKPATSGSGGGSPPAKFPTSSDPLLNGGNASKGNNGVGGAVLAGRVIDNYSKPPVDTSIRLVSVDGKDAGPPVDVTVTPEGYFTISNLQAGTNYKLVARGKNGEHLLAGITYTRAPNLTVVIQVREDFANAGTPDVLGGPALSDKKAKVSPGDEPTMPTVNVPTPSSNPAPLAPANQDWVAGPSVASDKGTFWPPPLDIPNPTAKPVPPPLQIPKTAPVPPPANFELGFPADDRLNGAARVPSCNLLGNQLVNFALNDVNGTDYEFKRNRRGKLVLIDFWATDCVYCVKNIPNLKNIQSKYGSGLEVIGIACEKGGSAQEQAIRVDKFAREKQLNYRQLVSTSPYCPVREQFRVNALPTMYLIDQNGMIIWRHEGFLARDSQGELERYIQKQLR